MAELLSINTYARRAYTKRYAFHRVRVSKTGDITGLWGKRHSGQALDPVNLGNIADCRTSQTDTGIRFYHKDFLVYTFALPGA